MNSAQGSMSIDGNVARHLPEQRLRVRNSRRQTPHLKIQTPGKLQTTSSRIPPASRAQSPGVQ